LIILLPVLVEGLPSTWQDAITRYLRSAVGQALIGRTKFTPPGHLLSPWAGFAVFWVYAAAALIAAAIPWSAVTPELHAAPRCAQAPCASGLMEACDGSPAR
jgi:hypothetical protein